MMAIVEEEQDIEHIRSLFLEYADSLSFSLGFQGFTDELLGLPGDYEILEGGMLLLYKSEQQAVGCAAMRRIDQDICEMKRLYVRPYFRGKGIGRELTLKIIEQTREMGYKQMRLDTLDYMKAAVKMYESLGFRYIQAYRYNPIGGALYMELNLEF